MHLHLEHIPFIVEACANWRELTQWGPPYWRPRSAAELQRKIADTLGSVPAGAYTLVIEDGGALIGECSLHAIDWRNRALLSISNTELKPILLKYQG